ncbi:MarR family winged helix-turn-helix transcriptional regulator [Streptococcus ovuberis]|uniref:HTH-type transcriptional regulator SarZ n=1 Tax=Streptococcus ovuberis TaxID=1936207 RepID=A0A7X6N2A7_9STRE|nr:MarR family transcriptional regulator [Streptococcus ovuberis]NKZ20814.1 MarR family transcriptional regulator [Streptococcus ovuberis]
MEKFNLSNQLCYSFYHVNRLFNQFYKEALAPFELTYTQYLVLLILWQEDTQSLQELGEQLDLASNTLTPLLRRLEDGGWLSRLRPEKDRRQLIVRLTDKGKFQQPFIEKALSDYFGQIPQLTTDVAQKLLEEHQVLITALKEQKDTSRP